MSLRGTLVVFLIVAVSWTSGLLWNQWSIERVVRDGYDTTGKVVSIETISRKLPFSLDGGWPRFVDGNWAVEVSWKDRSGVEHKRSAIGISDTYAARITTGNRVRLQEIQIRVVDGSTSQPVLLDDQADRLRSIRGILSFAVPLSLGLTIALTISMIWSLVRRRVKPQPARAIASGPARPFPYHLAVVTAICLGPGAWMLVDAYLDQARVQKMLETGEEASAEITRAIRQVRKPGEAPSYTVELTWTDTSGAKRATGPMHISPMFWRQIAVNDVQIVERTRIRYLRDNPDARPLITADIAERRLQDRVGVAAGIAFALLGLILGCFLVYRLRPTRSDNRQSPPAIVQRREPRWGD